MDILKLETELELNELLRDKSKDWESKEVKDFKKYLETYRAKLKHKTINIITPNWTQVIDDPKCDCNLCKKIKEILK